jgi:glycosyltransferase involved in cell wall biosynthesis
VKGELNAGKQTPTLTAVKRGRIVFYLGGFAVTGGVETFTTHLLSLVRKHAPLLICWGSNSELINVLHERRINVIRSPWKWGCRYSIPDWLLIPIGMVFARRAGVVLFGKVLPVSILRCLRGLIPRSVPFVLFTAYRPTVPPDPDQQVQLANLYNLFDAIVVQASAFGEDLRALGYRGNVAAIPYLSGDNARPVLAFPSIHEFRIGFVGRLVPDKNLPFLLASFSKFLFACKTRRRNVRSITLTLYGDGPERHALQARVAQLLIAEHVVFAGNIPHDKVADAIASCHVIAFSSIHEGQCLAALEALACGRPLVATPAGALPEILQDARLGVLVPSYSEELFAQGLEKVLDEIESTSLTALVVREAFSERYGYAFLGEQYMRFLAPWTADYQHGPVGGSIG